MFARARVCHGVSVDTVTRRRCGRNVDASLRRHVEFSENTLTGARAEKFTHNSRIAKIYLVEGETLR